MLMTSSNRAVPDGAFSDSTVPSVRNGASSVRITLVSGVVQRVLAEMRIQRKENITVDIIPPDEPGV